MSQPLPGTALLYRTDPVFFATIPIAAAAVFPWEIAERSPTIPIGRHAARIRRPVFTSRSATLPPRSPTLESVIKPYQ